MNVLCVERREKHHAEQGRDNTEERHKEKDRVKKRDTDIKSDGKTKRRGN